MNNAPKLHFVHCVNYENVGDWFASPLDYFAEYFVERYNVMYHDIDFIGWNDIAQNDAVILGGGGLFENEPAWQKAINRLLDSCGCVISWGVGFHRKSGQAAPSPDIDFSKFALLTVRDFEHASGFEYLPCVTCMMPQLRKERSIVREIGIINHKDYAITESSLDMIDNSASLETITDFIAESEAILTTSYHSAYWSLLMGKKTIVAQAWANKFEHFECKPALLKELSSQSVSAAISTGAAVSYKGWLDECTALSRAFFERVKTLLEAHIPKTSNASATVDLLKKQAWAPIPVYKRMGEMIGQINILVEDIGKRFEQIETICELLSGEQIKSEVLSETKETEEADPGFDALMEQIALMSEDNLTEWILEGFNKLPGDIQSLFINYYKQFPFWGALDPDNNVFDALTARAHVISGKFDDFIWLYDRLADARSKNALYAILLNWVNFNNETLGRYTQHNQLEYYHLDIFPFRKNEVLVDVGAYTGDSVADYITTYGADYKRIYCYEIMPDVFKQLEKNLKDVPNLVPQLKAAGAEPGVMYMDYGSHNSSGRVSDHGKTEVEVVRIDDDITEPVTFIKMDVEGAEQDALLGCERHIREEHPNLAISTYHGYDDICAIPRLIDKIKPGYKFYMRYHGGDLIPTEFSLLAVWEE